jgi:hypothetical protein
METFATEKTCMLYVSNISYIIQTQPFGLRQISYRLVSLTSRMKSFAPHEYGSCLFFSNVFFLSLAVGNKLTPITECEDAAC